MLRMLKSMAIAFSIYSKIPMPQFPWNEEDMKGMLVFFPWVGAVIGALLYGFYWLCGVLGIGNIAYVLWGMAIPLVVTGGFHVDGFLDTMDALHSYQPRERKLEILKDSHIGAFACIMLALYGLLYGGAFSEVRKSSILAVLCCGFFLSRCFSGIGVVTFLSAKKEGMVYTFSNQAEKRMVKVALYIQMILCMGLMLSLDLVAGALVIVSMVGSFWYYKVRMYKEFGGITGDTAGYFVLLSECVMMIVGAAIQILG